MWPPLNWHVFEPVVPSWLGSFEKLLVQAGYLTPGEVDARVAGRSHRPATTARSCFAAPWERRVFGLAVAASS